MEIENKSNNGIYIIMHAEEEVGQLFKKGKHWYCFFPNVQNITRKLWL